MNRLLFVDFYNINPHIETSFELVKRHLDQGDSVQYHFLGHDVPYQEHTVLSRPERVLFGHWLPERRAARLVANERFRFFGRTRLAIRELDGPVPATLPELKSWTHDGVDLGMGVASSLISRNRYSKFDPAQNERLVKDALISSVVVYEYCRRLFASERPDIVYVFNGRWCLARAALRAAQQAGIDVRIHERGADFNRYVVRDYIPHDRARLQEDIIEGWSRSGGSEMAVSEAKQWYEERRLGQPRDWPSFTTLQVRSLVPEFPKDKRIVTYFSSSDDEIAAIGESYKWEGWRDQADALTNLKRCIAAVPDAHLVIRLHPHLLKKHPDDMRMWLELAHAGSTATVIEPGSPVDSYSLIEASDVVVTSGSTVGMEAVYMDRPSILLGPSDYDLLGAVHVARSPEVLEALLRNRELAHDPTAAFPYGFYRATFGTKFEHYRPTGFFTGSFMGVELHKLPHLPGLLNRLKESVLKAVRAKRAAKPGLSLPTAAAPESR